MDLLIVSALSTFSLIRPPLAKHIANILEPDDSGKRFDYFLVFFLSCSVHPPLIYFSLIRTCWLNWPHIYTQIALKHLSMNDICVLITFHILTLRFISGKEGLPFLLPVPLTSTSPRVNIHFFQTSFSVGLCREFLCKWCHLTMNFWKRYCIFWMRKLMHRELRGS